MVQFRNTYKCTDIQSYLLVNCVKFLWNPLWPKLCCVVAVEYCNIVRFNTTATTQHNLGVTKHRDVEIGVCVTNRGFQRNLSQLTSRYD